MIYSFSGTGNSRHVARLLAEGLATEVRSMCGAGQDLSGMLCDTLVGLVFPVYGWRMPNVVRQFIETLPMCPSGSDVHVFAILTCGDDIGRTDRLLRKALAHRGWPLHAVYSVQMRNTYVCLPGFDVDCPQVELEKQCRADEWLRTHVLPSIQHRKPSTTEDVHPGACPALKTYVLGPLFHRWLISPKHFQVSDSCNGCGRCGKVCPLHNINYDADHHPVWSAHCAHCLACYHACPHHAISYGPFTRGKGQVKVTL